MNDVLTALLRANIVAAATVLAVLLLRLPARRLFGPEAAYRLWIAPPLTALATILPPRAVEDVQVSFLSQLTVERPLVWMSAWILGSTLVLASFSWAQVRFMSAVKAGRAGPAVVGVIAPRIVMPEAASAYTPEELSLIRAHEREHIRRLDPRAGGVAAILQALCWFNPLAHLAAHLMRLDQELACDAAVLRHRPRDRALYAKTLLKTQLAAQALPFGCYWLAHGRHPLEVRVGLLGDARPHEGLAGPVLMTGLAAVAAVAAWGVQPPVLRHPPPMISFWDAHQQGPTMSVLLVRAPPAHRDDA